MFLYLFHFRSLLRLTLLLSPNKQNEKLNFGLLIEYPVQDAGPTLALEAAFTTELELLRRGAL